MVANGLGLLSDARRDVVERGRRYWEEGRDMRPRRRVRESWKRKGDAIVMKAVNREIEVKNGKMYCYGKSEDEDRERWRS